MLYRIVKPLARWILGINFRRIHIAGIEKLPAKGPIILACNHPTAFIEPCVMASFQKRPLYFLVRGDFFRKKIFSYFLNVLHMIPIFRMKDGGFSNIKNNFSSFERCYESLGEGKALMILAEGFCIHEKRLRPIRKGTARIALGAYEENEIEDLLIFPVGVNYTNSDAFRSDLMISFGKAIPLKDYLHFFQPNKGGKPEAVRQLTEAIAEGLANHVIHIEDKQDVDLLENIWELWRNDHLNPQEELYTSKANRLITEKGISDKINDLEGVKKEELDSRIKKYFQELEKQQVQDLAFSRNNKKGSNYLLLLLGWPFFLLGTLLNFLPLLLINAIGKIKGISIEFRHSVKLGAGLGIFIIWLLILGFIGGQFNIWLLPIICILVPILGWMAIRYWEFLSYWRKISAAKKINAPLKQELITQRAKIITTLIDNGLWE